MSVCLGSWVSSFHRCFERCFKEEGGKVARGDRSGRALAGGCRLITATHSVVVLLFFFRCMFHSLLSFFACSLGPELKNTFPVSHNKKFIIAAWLFSVARHLCSFP